MRLIIILIVTTLLLMGYQMNTTNYKHNMDFGNGGFNETLTNYKSTTGFGQTPIPFNQTDTKYTIQQGLYYIVGSNILVTDVNLVLDFIFKIQGFGIEWVRLNWTS